jgi:hypothetical protein
MAKPESTCASVHVCIVRRKIAAIRVGESGSQLGLFYRVPRKFRGRGLRRRF